MPTIVFGQRKWIVRSGMQAADAPPSLEFYPALNGPYKTGDVPKPDSHGEEPLVVLIFTNIESVRDMRHHLDNIEKRFYPKVLEWQATIDDTEG